MRRKKLEAIWSAQFRPRLFKIGEKTFGAGQIGPHEEKLMLDSFARRRSRDQQGWQIRFPQRLRSVLDSMDAKTGKPLYVADSKGTIRRNPDLAA